jgi:CubicO group peptidase (beta-lactamase class C family)
VLGLDTTALHEHQALCAQSGADACLIAYRGLIVQEWYGPEYEEPVPTMSSVKSWTALLALLLEQEGKLDLDAPVARYIPQWTGGAEAGVTVRHLLTMTAGLRQRTEEAPGPRQSIGYVTDKNAFALSLSPDDPPGTRWEYSNEGVQILSPVLEAAAGVPLEDYARETLFIPLGMTETSLRLDAAGNPWTYADAKTTLRDFATICQFMLNGGRWGGRQVIAESAIQSAVRPTAQNPQYGMLWWLIPDPAGFAAMGYLDTSCFAFPALDMVVARVQARPKHSATMGYINPSTFALYRRIALPASMRP